MVRISVYSRAQRILKYLSGYSSADSNDVDIKLSDCEEVIGIYESDPGKLIVVTNAGLHIKDNKKWNYVDYHIIKKAENPIGKTNIKGFNLILEDSTLLWLPVSGVEKDKYYDAFEFIRYIDRVIKDVRSE